MNQCSALSCVGPTLRLCVPFCCCSSPGALSGLSQVFLACPSELVKIQMQIQTDASHTQFTGPWHCARHIVRIGDVLQLGFPCPCGSGVSEAVRPIVVKAGPFSSTSYSPPFSLLFLVLFLFLLLFLLLLFLFPFLLPILLLLSPFFPPHPSSRLPSWCPNRLSLFFPVCHPGHHWAVQRVLVDGSKGRGTCMVLPALTASPVACGVLLACAH